MDKNEEIQLTPPALRLHTRTQTLFIDNITASTLTGAARVGYHQGAKAMLKMLKEAQAEGDRNVLLKATKYHDFWAKVANAQVDFQD